MRLRIKHKTRVPELPRVARVNLTLEQPANGALWIGYWIHDIAPKERDLTGLVRLESIINQRAYTTVLPLDAKGVIVRNYLPGHVSWQLYVHLRGRVDIDVFVPRLRKY